MHTMKSVNVQIDKILTGWCTAVKEKATISWAG